MNNDIKIESSGEMKREKGGEFWKINNKNNG